MAAVAPRTRNYHGAMRACRAFVCLWREGGSGWLMTDRVRDVVVHGSWCKRIIASPSYSKSMAGSLRTIGAREAVFYSSLCREGALRAGPD